MAAEDIGCSLAEAAQSASYDAYLADAGKVKNAVHVIYINTGLDTKAAADAKIPTITCTSSNVVATVLQAAAQIPDVHVYYGPDTYMGGNLAELLRRMTTWTSRTSKPCTRRRQRHHQIASAAIEIFRRRHVHGARHVR